MISEEVKNRLRENVGREDLRELSPVLMQAIDIIGLSLFIDLCYVIGGLSIYIPKFESVVAAARDRLILNEFNGYNYSELAIKYGITEVWVRQIIAKANFKENAISLFDEPEDKVS